MKVSPAGLLTASLLTLALTAVFAPAAEATVLERLSIEEMAERADAVLVVEAQAPKAKWAADALGRGRAAIETQVDVVVVDVLKGTPKRGALQRIHTLGGKVGGVGLEVEGLPTWRAGEKCLVFLDAKGRVIGGQQGKIAVDTDGTQAAAESLDSIEGRVRRAVRGATASSAGTSTSTLTSGSVVRMQEANDDVPGVPLPPSPMAGWVDTWADPEDVYAVHLHAGQTLTLSLTGPADADLDLILYGPGTPSVNGAIGSAWMLAASRADFTNEHITYTATANGTYYIDVHPFECRGSYTLAYSKSDIGDPVPMVTGITPGSGSAGTGTEVTIGGSGFGTTLGRVYFTFVGGASRQYVRAPVTSWSDSKVRCIVPIGVVEGYPASAGSGPVFVMTGEGVASAGTTFTVTFGYTGHKWQGSEVAYRIAPSATLGEASTNAVKAGAALWNGAGGGLKLKYLGKCTSREPVLNDYNDISWAPLEEGVIGITGSWYENDTNRECDTAFNTLYDWGVDDPLKMDVQTVAAHELGHWLGLRDLYGDGDGDKMMYGFGAEGVFKHALTAGDRAGAQWLYPPPPSAKSASFSNPIAYDIASLLKTHMVANIDQSNVRAKIVVKTSLGNWTVFDRDIANVAGVDCAFPNWDGKDPATGRRVPYAASYDWVLTLTKNGRSSTKTGKVLLSNVYFVRAASSGINVTTKHTGYLRGSAASPRSVNVYLTASAASPGSLSVRVTGPLAYSRVPANTPWNIGTGAPPAATATLTGASRLKANGIYTFAVVANTRASYRISVIE